MESKNYKSLEFLLNHPKTDHVTHDVNTETIERRSFYPKKIKLFSSKFTHIKDCPEYKFKHDNEASKALPDIINNSVQKIVSGQEKSESEKQNFSKSRNIGVVFSGGPAPGGHNVFAGIYDETKKYNSDSRVFGFLFGPDGVLESKYIEITQSLVDAYRNLGGFTMIKTAMSLFFHQILYKPDYTVFTHRCKESKVSIFVSLQTIFTHFSTQVSINHQMNNMMHYTNK